MNQEIEAKVAEFVRLFDEMHDHYFRYSDGHHKHYEGGVVLTWRYGSYHERRGEWEPHLPLGGPYLEVSSYLFAPEGRSHSGALDEMLEWVRSEHRREMARTYEDLFW